MNNRNCSCLAVKFQDAGSKTVVYDPQFSSRRIDKAIKNVCIRLHHVSCIFIISYTIITNYNVKSNKNKK